MLFFAFTLFFISSNARITQGGLDPLHNVQLSEDSSKRAVPTGPNPLHNDYPPLPGPPHLKQNLVSRITQRGLGPLRIIQLSEEGSKRAVPTGPNHLHN